jgi:hypothetical protein
MITSGLLTEKVYLPKRQAIDARRGFYYAAGAGTLNEGERVVVALRASHDHSVVSSPAAEVKSQVAPAALKTAKRARLSTVPADDTTMHQLWLDFIQQKPVTTATLRSFAASRDINLHNAMTKKDIVKVLFSQGILVSQLQQFVQDQ